MPKESETKLVAPVMQDVRKNLTEKDLMTDAAKVVHQLEQFYLPGEVEATVVLSFRGIQGHPAVATSVESADRLKWQLGCAVKSVPRMALRVSDRKIIT